jgi:hypothetical protein
MLRIEMPAIIQRQEITFFVQKQTLPKSYSRYYVGREWKSSIRLLMPSHQAAVLEVEAMEAVQVVLDQR